MNMTNSNVREKSLGFTVCLALGVVFVGGICAAQTESIPADSPRWQLEGKAQVADYLGRRCLSLQGGVATLKDFEIADGVIDLDIVPTENSVQSMVDVMGICEVLSAPRSPWQRAYVERVIGSIRRECLDHVIVFHENSLRRTLNSYFHYYHRSRTHLSLGKDSPEPRAIQPLEMGPVVAVPQVGGLHHRYERRAA